MGFEEQYIALRKAEGRLFEEEEIRQLPYLPKGNPLRKEWKLRAKTMKRFIAYLQKNPRTSLLDIGCGNGWFTRQAAPHIQGFTLGQDINALELSQAQRYFQQEKLIFTTEPLDHLAEDFPKAFELITFNASFQYFSPVEDILNTARELLQAKGEIHILDTPFYTEREAIAAKKRTEKYYSGMGFPGMSDFYFHHTFESLAPYHPELLFNPGFLSNSGFDSPFPWIRIKAENL